MTERLVAAIPAESSQVLPARLEPDAIGAAQDTIIGMANSAPTVAIGLSLAGSRRGGGLWQRAGHRLIAVTWVYLLSSSIADAFTQLIDLTGVLYASFYILTALSAIVYYRRRVFSNAWDAVLVGILPVAAAGFLTWIVVKSTQNAAASQKWSLIGIVVAGVVLMFVARFVLRSPFFQIPRESAAKER